MNRDNGSILTTRVRIKPHFKTSFVKWQARLHEAIASFPGFSSLEISIDKKDPSTWSIIQRFQDQNCAMQWQKSETRELLLNEIRNILLNVNDLQDHIHSDHQGVMEVFVTQINQENEKNYREWLAKIHQAEAAFPGFQRVYVQAPKNGMNWISFLQFDRQENLDRWLTSKEREELLNEGKQFISSMESHRVISPFAGWFPVKGQKGPPLWKQTMLILLILFPIVMLEFKFLSPIIRGLNISLGTFIGNAISVSLISWPLMPITLFFLGWWMLPKNKLYTLLGTLLILVLYLIEIIIFWNLL